MATKLFVPRVEIQCFGGDSWCVRLCRSAQCQAYSVTVYSKKWEVKRAARKWSAETGWPLVIDGEVVEPK